MNLNRILYFDVLRALAIIFVVFWHVSYLFSTNLSNYNIVTPICSLVRIAIPIFLMISGALIISQKKYDISEFFKRRFNRVFIPYIFWVIIYFILGSTIIPDHYGLFAFDNTSSLSIQYLISVFFSLSEFSALFWFIWCIIGFYLITPILNSFVKDYGLKGIEYILAISILCILIPTLGLELSALTNKLSYITTFFTCYFYPILGYYLHNKKFNISNKMLIIVGLILFILGYCLSLNTMYFGGISDFTIKFLDMNHLYVVIESLGLFLMFKYIFMYLDNFKNITSSVFMKLIVSLSECSYGIYFVHMILLDYLLTLKWFIQFTVGKAYIWIPLFSCSIILISWFIIGIMSKTPVLKSFK